MKTEFFNNTIKNFYSSLIAISAFAIATGCGGGGGGGGGGTPPVTRSPYITVASVTPTDGLVDVDAQISEIKVTMSVEVDPASFIQEGTALMNLINARKATPDVNGMSITEIRDAANAIVDVTKLKLEQLASGNYSVVGKYLSNVNGAAQLVTGTIKIVGYQFVAEENTGLSSLLIFVDGGAAPFTFTGAELIASKYVNSNMFRIEKLNSTGAVAVAALGQVTVSGRTISFRPINFLEWGAKYRITVKKDAGNTPDTQGVRESVASAGSDTQRTLENDFVTTFTTKTLPKAQIVSVLPSGIDASPVGLIKATTNFKVDLATLTAANVKLSRKVKTSNIPVLNPTTGQQEIPYILEPVEYSLSYDGVQSQIVITPAGDLRYLQEYQVDIKGGSGGIKGSMGTVSGRFLEEPVYSWTFTTADAKVVSTSVTSNTPVDGNGQAALFKVKMNFRPDPATVLAGVRLFQNTSAGPVFLNYTPSVTNDEITLTPQNALQYGGSYSVEVNSNLISLPLRGTENQNEPVKVALASTYIGNHTMDIRKLESHVPSSGLDISETSSIVLSFNFDIPDSMAINLKSYINVSQSSATPVNVTIERHINNKRTVEIKTNVPYTFGATVNVSFNSMNVEGQSVSTYPITLTVVKSNTFVVTSKMPSATTNVSMITEISVGFNYMLKPLTSSQTSTGYSASAIRVYPRNCSGSYSELGGRITYDTNRIYFIPSSSLKSWCEYEVVVNKDLVSDTGRTQPNEYSYRFTTNGLSVLNVYVTYAYEDLVDIDESIEVVFNYDLDWSQWSDSVQLYNNRTRSYISGSISVWNNRLTFNPSGSLIYGDNYTLIVRSGTWGVEGDNGETMKSDYSVSFDTQNLPISVDNYGPIGTVRTDTRFWIEFSKNVNTPNYPRIYGYLNGSSQTVTNDNVYTFGFKPSYLNTSSDYTVKFEWIYDNGFRDDSSFSWSIRTSATASAMAARGASAGGDKTRLLSMRPAHISEYDFNDSCVTYKSCTGKLPSYNVQEYRQQTIRGKVKADIATKNSRERAR